ncbi:MAG: hypothetical protein AAFX10_08615 [Pseudomonadota bacterium]
MTKRLVTLSLGAALLATAGAAAAACEYPDRADLPNGATATEEEMIAGQRSIKKFMADMDAYLACIEKETEGADVEGEDPEIAAQRQAIAVKRHNAAVDELEQVAAAFNEQVRAFKARED